MAGFALGIFLAFPSSHLVAKLLGPAGFATYALLVIVVCALLWQRRPGLLERDDPAWTIGILFIAFAITFALVFPVLDAGEAFGRGSDRDEALNIGVRAMLAGRQPYAETTYLQNPISPLPGSLILAAPFVWIGDAAWQNVFWFGGWLALLVRILGTGRTLAAALLTLAASPAVPHDLLTGGDLFVNAVMVMCAGMWTASATTGRHLALSAAAAGVAVATRYPFLLLVPLLAGFVYRRHGAIRTAVCLAILAATSALVTLPFYLNDPGSFAPFVTQNKFRFLVNDLPGADRYLPAICAAVALIAPAVVWRRSWTAWLVAAGAVLLLPVILYAAAALVAEPTGTATAGYALPALVFAVPGLLMRDDGSRGTR